jgi:hypothetical protein
MIRPLRTSLDFDEAVLNYTQARLAWEDRWGADGVDVLLHRLLHFAERMWSFLRPPVVATPLTPGALAPHVIEALNNPALARLLATPRGALALARLIEREEQRLAQEAERRLGRDLAGLRGFETLGRMERARAAERDVGAVEAELRPARPARFARARPLREDERGQDEPVEQDGRDGDEGLLEVPTWSCDAPGGCLPADDGPGEGQVMSEPEAVPGPEESLEGAPVLVTEAAPAESAPEAP